MLEMLPSSRRQLKRTGEAMSRQPFEVLKEQLDREMAEAAERMRVTGEAPTAETAPLLVKLWTSARDRLGNNARCFGVVVMHFNSIRLQITSLRGESGFLRKFYLRDYASGELLVSCDARGPARSLADSNPKVPA